MRLRTIIKRINVLICTESELSRQQAFIESRLLEHQRERTRLDNQLDNGIIDALVWTAKTDIVDMKISEAQNLIDELGSKIKEKEEERFQLEDQLKQYKSDEINKAIELLGIFDE